MYYPSIIPAQFLSRPNRFVAICRVEGKDLPVHVKNTGRCGELLIPGCTVYIQHRPAPGRKTEYDLICVDRGGVLVNIDSQAPVPLLAQALRDHTVPISSLQGMTDVCTEQRFGDSRLDFSAHKGETLYYGEIKGVTLEQDGTAYFPDAPTQRGIRHIHELEKARAIGFGALLIFIVQMPDVQALRPNDRTHPAFGQALRQAITQGVQAHAITCTVTPDTLLLQREIPILTD